MKKWPVVLSTTEQNNYIGLVQVRQGNRNSEVLEATITENGLPLNLLKCRVYLEAYLGKESVELPCKILDAEKGLIEFVFNDLSMQKTGVVTANLKIISDDYTNTTQDFTYIVIPAVSQTEIETGSYWQSVQDLIKDLETVINAQKGDFDKWMETNRENYLQWFESIKSILEDVDPGGKLLKEVLDARRGIEGALHNSISERLLADFDYIKTELLRQHYTLKSFEVHTLEILQDDNFSLNHEVEKVGEVDFDAEDGALVIATVDDRTQNVFKMEKVGEIDG